MIHLFLSGLSDEAGPPNTAALCKNVLDLPHTIASNNGHDIGNSRSMSGSPIDIGYFEILEELGRMMTPANYDNCRASAAGSDGAESESLQRVARFRPRLRSASGAT